MKPLLEVICKNRRLQSLNLSWNNIQDAKASDKEKELILNHIGKVIKHNKSM